MPGAAATNLEQLEPKGLDPGEHAVERSLIGQVPDQHGHPATPPGVQLGKGTHQPFAEASADLDLVA